MKGFDARWDTAVDWLLNHRAVALDYAPVFFAYTDGLISLEELRAESVGEYDAEEMPRVFREVIEERRAAVESGKGPHVAIRRPDGGKAHRQHGRWETTVCRPDGVSGYSLFASCTERAHIAAVPPADRCVRCWPPDPA